MDRFDPQAVARAAAELGMSFEDLADRLGGAYDVGRLSGADLQQRDDLLRAAATRHFPNPSRNWQADRLSEALERYKTSAWRQRDQWAETCPHEPGSRAGDLWRILRLSSHIPSARTLRRLLAIRV